MANVKGILDCVEDTISLHTGSVLDVRRAAALISALHNRKACDLVILVILKRVGGARLALIL